MIVTEKQKQALLSYVKDFQEDYREFDEKRASSIKELKSLIEDFIYKKITLKEFKERSGLMCRKFPYWGFKGFSGQMQLNQYVKNIDDKQKENVLREALIVPGNEHEVVERIDSIFDYITELRKQLNYPKGFPWPSQIFMLTYFWEIQIPEEWPIYYDASKKVLSNIGFDFSASDSHGKNYLEFTEVIYAIKELYEEEGFIDKKHPIWFIEHVLWKQHQAQQSTSELLKSEEEKKEGRTKRTELKKEEKIIAIGEEQVENFFQSLTCSEPQPFFVAMGDTRNLQKLDSENKIIYNTEFQRGEVWDLPRKQKLIDSILRGYNINTIFFRQLPDGRFECLDGQQRLKTILKEFLNDKFPINPKITLEFNRRTYFSELPESLKSKIKIYPIYTIIFYTDKDEETCKIFLRLQEGLPLNSAEKLNAMIGFFRNEIVELAKHPFMRKLGMKDYRFAHRYILAQVYLLTLRNQITDVKFRTLREIYGTYKMTRPPEAVTNTIKRTINFLDKQFGEETGVIKYNADFISLFLLAKYMLENYAINETDVKLKEFFIQFLTKVGQVESSEREEDAPYYDYKTYRKASADSRSSIEKRFNIILSKFLEFAPDIKPKDPTREFNYWEKLAVYWRDKGICQICSKKTPFEEGSVDHKIPHSKGGSTMIANGQWLCKKCNLEKLDKII